MKHLQVPSSRVAWCGVCLLVSLGILGASAATTNKRPPDATKRQKITPILMFEGKAEEAMNFYLSLFPNSKVVSIERYAAGDEMGKEGSVKHAIFSLGGQEFMCIDSAVKHPFTFTPSISMFVTCESEAEIDDLFKKLSQDGIVMMPLAEYPFSRKFAWISDRFGVSWQLSWQLSMHAE
jgi:predicted 3-demethylubiquinone-9 3-methyltransferase (glyoxalase superfamily)